MTENVPPVRSAAVMRLSLTQSFLQRIIEWEDQYQHLGEAGLRTIEEFRLAWEQIKQVYDWAAKYMPTSFEWRVMYCQITLALTPFWRRHNENETIQRKWLLCALHTATIIQQNDLKCAFLEHLGNLFYDTNAFQKSVLYYGWALQAVNAHENSEIEARLLTSQANALRDFAQRQRTDSPPLLEEAETHYLKALELAPPGSQLVERAYSNYGILKVRQDRVEEAIDLFLNALQLARDLSDWIAQRRNLGNLAAAYQNIGNFDEAMSCATQAIELADRTREPRGRSQAYAARGFIHRKQGRFDEALVDFKQAFNIADRAQLNLIAARQGDNLAEIYFVQGRLEEAVAESDFAYSVALSKNVSREIGFHGFTHGWNLIAVGRIPEAVEVFNTVTAQGGGQATIQALVARGVAYYLLGDCEHALQDVDNAIIQAQNAIARSRQYKALQVIGLGETIKSLCGIGNIQDALQAYDEACTINRERGSIERQLILLEHLDPDHDTRLDSVRVLLTSYLS